MSDPSPTQLATLEPGLRVLVTAAAAGIGRAIADTLAANGARLFVCDVDEPALERLRGERPDWRTAVCDVADRVQVDRMFEELARAFGGLDVLVNNAGIAGPTGGIDAIEPEDWYRTIDVNLNGAYLCARRAAPMLKASRGVMVNISSVAGRLGYAFRTPYAASKWAIVGLSKSLAKELGRDGVRVNAVLPGVVAGPRIQRVIEARAAELGVPHAEMERHYREQGSLGRMVEAEDIAAMVLFLCGPGGRNVSGQALSVCGNVETI